MKTVFIKSPTGTHTCTVISYDRDERINKAQLKVKGLVPNQNVTTSITIENAQNFEDHKEVSSIHGYYKILKPIEKHEKETDQ